MESFHSDRYYKKRFKTLVVMIKFISSALLADCAAWGISPTMLSLIKTFIKVPHLRIIILLRWYNVTDNIYLKKIFTWINRWNRDHFHIDIPLLTNIEGGDFYSSSRPIGNQL